MEIILTGTVGSVQYDAMVKYLENEIAQAQDSQVRAKDEKATREAQLATEFPMGDPGEGNPGFETYQELTVEINAFEAKIAKTQEIIAESKAQMKELVTASESGQLNVIPGDPTTEFYKIGEAVAGLRNSIVSQQSKNLTTKELEGADSQAQNSLTYSRQLDSESDAILKAMDKAVADVTDERDTAMIKTLDGLFADGEGGLSEAIDRQDLPEEVVATLNSLIGQNELNVVQLLDIDAFTAFEELRQEYGQVADPLSDKATAFFAQYEFMADDVAEDGTLAKQRAQNHEDTLKDVEDKAHKASDIRGLEAISMTASEYDEAKATIYDSHEAGQITDREKAEQLRELEVAYRDLKEDGKPGTSFAEISRLNDRYADLKVAEGKVDRSARQTEISYKEYDENGQAYATLNDELAEFTTEVTEAEVEVKAELVELTVENDKRTAEYEKAKVESEEILAEKLDIEKVKKDEYDAEEDATKKAEKAKEVVDATTTRLIAELHDHKLDLVKNIGDAFHKMSKSRLEAQESEINQAKELIEGSIAEKRQEVGELLAAIPSDIVEKLQSIDDGVIENLEQIEILWDLGSTPPEGEDEPPYPKAIAEFHDSFYAKPHEPGFFESSTLSATKKLIKIWDDGKS